MSKKRKQVEARFRSAYRLIIRKTISATDFHIYVSTYNLRLGSRVPMYIRLKHRMNRIYVS